MSDHKGNFPLDRDASPIVPNIGAISNSSLFQKRTISREILTYAEIHTFTEESTASPYQTRLIGFESPSTSSSVDGWCSKCFEHFESQDEILHSTDGQLWHVKCFVCAQCFQPFEDNTYFTFDGYNYCQYDYERLYGAMCRSCKKIIIGRVIKALNSSWHPACFRCQKCNEELVDKGFLKINEDPFCSRCHGELRAEFLTKHVCRKCNYIIHEEPLRFQGELFHPYHFNCEECGQELDSNAREIINPFDAAKNRKGKLVCLRCHDKKAEAICAACRIPIEGRSIAALGKHWHIEHFVCKKCEKPFMGSKFLVAHGNAYCERHYYELYGNVCYICDKPVKSDEGFGVRVARKCASGKKWTPLSGKFLSIYYTRVAFVDDTS